MRLARTGGLRRGRVTLVPLIDVLFILLVYFMVTSVYRDLDMIPVSRQADLPPAPTPTSTSATSDAGEGAARVLLRIGADGAASLRGAAVDAGALAALAARDPVPQVLILPSGAAPLGALTDVLDALAAAGLTDTRLVRVAAE